MQQFVVDISALKVGNSIHLRDITLPEGVKTVDSLDETIVSVVAPQAAQEAVAAVESVALNPCQPFEDSWINLANHLQPI